VLSAQCNSSALTVCVVTALRVHTLARQREDGFDRGGLWCFHGDTALRSRRLCRNEWQLVITSILERIIAVAVELRL